MENGRKQNVLHALFGNSPIESPDSSVDPQVLFEEGVRVDARNWCQGNRLGEDANSANLVYDGLADVDAISIAEE